ncbi:MAG TPA: hypothetical protein EYP41_14930, partial [Anaerolineae bacterium]|nr:hypothetical protein [Anaerolineae bacterium]
QWGGSADFGWLALAYFIIQAIDGNVLVPLLFLRRTHPALPAFPTLLRAIVPQSTCPSGRVLDSATEHWLHPASSYPNWHKKPGTNKRSTRG